MQYNLPQALIDMSRPTKKRPQYAKLKESKNITIQNGALLLDMKVDELISAIPAKVATK